mmetsp:Transcript_22553/g.50028  ORF Transcript_22553/g.50028 Transcript_22553/m.50028 type:complete len:218 (-) Transcript_22553:20-673(-)
MAARRRAAFMGFSTTPISSFPSSTPAWTAQPSATASSGSTVLWGVTPVREEMIRPMVGIRVAPPTRTIREIGRPEIPSARTLVFSGRWSRAFRDSARYLRSRFAVSRAFFRPFCWAFLADRMSMSMLVVVVLLLPPPVLPLSLSLLSPAGPGCCRSPSSSSSPSSSTENPRSFRIASSSFLPGETISKDGADGDETERLAGAATAAVPPSSSSSPPP